MKPTLYLLVLSLTFLRPVSAQVPEGQLVYPIEPNTLVIFSGPSLAKVAALRTSAIPINVQMEVEPRADPGSALSAPLKVSYTGSGPLQLRLVQLDVHDLPVQEGSPATGRISTHHYAIAGEVAYENVAGNSYLEMWSYFASPAPGYPEASFFSRTLGDGGPMGKLDGTSSWREFRLPFDSTGTTSKLERLELNLRLGGPGTVHLRNMKLMQYPDAPAATSSPTTTAGTSAPFTASSEIPFAKVGEIVEGEQIKALKLIWFCLGVAATAVTLLVITSLIFVSRRWQRRHHERELRRIASLDT